MRPVILSIQVLYTCVAMSIELVAIPVQEVEEEQRKPLEVQEKGSSSID